MLDEKETEELAKLEASMERMNDLEAEDIDSDFYEDVLARIVALREKRDI
jgi:DNA replication initiation complex subunit (GINS family)